MKRILATAAGCALLAVLAACASTPTTTFTATWKAPDAQPIDPAGRKVAAVFISTDEGTRRAAEDVLVKKLDEYGAEGVASYSIIPSAELYDMDKVRQRLAAAGVAGIVTMRVIDQKQETRVRYSGPRPAFAPYYWYFSGYWGYGWSVPYAPEEVTTHEVMRIETLVYSLKRDALVWAGTSRTVDGDKVTPLVEEVADAAAAKMQKQGLLPQRS